MANFSWWEAVHRWQDESWTLDEREVGRVGTIDGQVAHGRVTAPAERGGALRDALDALLRLVFN